MSSTRRSKSKSRSLSKSIKSYYAKAAVSRKKSKTRTLSKSSPHHPHGHDEYVIQGTRAEFLGKATASSLRRPITPPAIRKKGFVESKLKSGLDWYKKWRWDDKQRLATRVALRVRRDALLQLTDSGLALLASAMKEPQLRRRYLLDADEEDPNGDMLTKERQIANVIQKTFKYYPKLGDFKSKDQEVLRGIFYECSTDVPHATIQPMFFNNKCTCVALRSKDVKDAMVYVLPDAMAKKSFLITEREYEYDPEVGECTPNTPLSLYGPQG